MAPFYIIPVVARNPGAAGSDWRTELCITNHLLDSGMNIGVVLFQGQVDGNLLFQLSGGETLCSEDFLLEWFGLSKWSGAVVLSSAADLNPDLTFGFFDVSVRVYNLTPNGTYGLSVTPEPVITPVFDDSFDLANLWNASGVHNFGTPGVDGSRTSVGAFNANDYDLELWFAVTDSQGQFRWTKSTWVGAGAQVQFSLPRNLTVPDGGLYVEVINGPAGYQHLVFPYLTVTDNKTGDGRYVAAGARWSADAKSGFHPQ